MDRLWNRTIKKENECIEFTGSLRAGYGAIKINGRIESTHRVSYALTFGEIPQGFLVCHKCDNKKCINPEHLFLGSYKDNMQDCKEKGRLIVPIGKIFKKGDIPSNLKYPIKKCLDIKEQIKNRNKISLKEISIKNNVSYQFVRDISSNRILKDR